MLNRNAQDHFASDFRVYLDGVQIPFESAHITNSYKEAPTASVTLPPWPGLQEVGKNYAPKVHIFWKDPNFGVSRSESSTNANSQDIRNKTRDAYKLIFSGTVTGISDSKEVSANGGGQSITMQCSHHSDVFADILLRFANQQISAAQTQIDVQAEGSQQSSEWDLNTLMIKALQGIDFEVKEGDIRHIPEGTFSKLKGTPGMLRVLWNVLKKDANRTQGTGNDSEALVDMFIPMVEEGIKFWNKLSGHPSIEEGIAADTVPYSSPDIKRGVNPDIVGDIMIPGAFRTFIGAAAQTELSIAVMNSVTAGLGTPESVDFRSIMDLLLQKLEYDMVTLSSPISKSDGTSIEYLVKPSLPYYYSPICNVVLPNMLSSISVNSDYNSIPTRTVSLGNLTALVNGASSGGAPSTQYTSPHSVRYARAGGQGGDLADSLSAYNNRVGRYEWGRGIKSSTSQLPPIYNVLQANLDAKEKANPDDSLVGPAGKTIAEQAWMNSYPTSKWPGSILYNPWSSESGISAFQRLNFLYADHDFAMETARARTAQASGCFNPYAIVGYPMDLVDPVPSRESYHGLCTSVSHTIHASGTSTTSYSMAAVSSFSELALYNLPAVNPYLTAALEFDEDFRIYGNAKAYAKACQVYQEVLGCGAAEPALLQDYETGTPIPFTRDASSGSWTNTESSDLYNTQQGSLILVARNIQSLIEVEAERGFSEGFIDIADWIDTKPDDVQTIPSTLRVEMEAGSAKILTQGIDAESSPFLEYLS
ncbi:hypothetical protein VPHD148_0009 [Vibrio phage D148]